MLDATEASYLAGARSGDEHHFTKLTEPYRAELQVHCYRMLGSLQDAEDLVQETLLRAWKHLRTFEGRASFRAWLYKIATNACLDALAKRSRRVLPTVTYSATDPQKPFSPPTPDPIWLDPLPDTLLAGIAPSAEAHYTVYESVRLAFLVALQILPPRQRAVLILRDVLGWRAKEVADLLEMTVSAANSVLHRARTTLVKHYHPTELDEVQVSSIDETTQKLLDQYTQAWESADVTGLVTLLKEDAAFTMPPSSSWYQGREAINTFLTAVIFVGENNQWRLKPIQANSQPAFGLYKRNPERDVYQAFAIQVLTIEEAQITDVTNFLNPTLFSRFGLPPHLEA